MTENPGDGRDPVENGYFTTLDNRGHELPYDQILKDFEQATLKAEELGFRDIWMGEHHFGYEGVGFHPNPVVTGVWLAARTKSVWMNLDESPASDPFVMRFAAGAKP